MSKPKRVLRWSGRHWVQQAERSPPNHRGMWRQVHNHFAFVGNVVLDAHDRWAELARAHVRNHIRLHSA